MINRHIAEIVNVIFRIFTNFSAIPPMDDMGRIVIILLAQQVFSV